MTQHTPRRDLFTVQTWSGQARVHNDLQGLSIEAAREVALVHVPLGYTGRIMSEDRDYCEVYTPDGRVRKGTHAQTTEVTVNG